MVQREGGDAGRLVSGSDSVACGLGSAAEPGHDLPQRRVDQHLSRLDHAERRVAAVVQLRLGPGAPGVAHHAEPGRSHRRRSARDPLRRGAAALAAEHDAAAGRPPREVLRRLAGEPGLQRYWKPLNVEETFAKIAVPVHTFGGWFDIFSQGTLRGYVGMSQKGPTERIRRGSNIVIGAWGHGSSQKTGDIDFGPAAHVNEQALQLRWYDYWLKGIDNGLAAEPPVKLFVMGRNDWVLENEYPLARTEYRPFYFASGGKANSDRGDGRLTWQKPAGSSRRTGSATIQTIPFHHLVATTAAARRLWQVRATSARSSGVRTSWSTPRSHWREIEVTGPVKVVLHASSDAPDTDFVAKLVDVHPDGTSYDMAEGIVRARYRESVAAPTPLTPGKVYRFEIDGRDVGGVPEGAPHPRPRHEQPFPAVRSQPEHRSEVPSYGRDVRVAEQTIVHDADHPSHILLPVIPARTR